MNKTFPDFNNLSSLTTGDFLVGCDKDGLSEFRSTLWSIAEALRPYMQSGSGGTTPTPTQNGGNSTPTPTPTQGSGGESGSGGSGGSEPTTIPIDITNEATGDPHYRLSFKPYTTTLGNTVPNCSTKYKFATNESTQSGHSAGGLCLKAGDTTNGYFFIKLDNSKNIELSGSKNHIATSDFSCLDYVPNWVRHLINFDVENKVDNIVFNFKTSNIQDLENYEAAIFYSIADDSASQVELKIGTFAAHTEATNGEQAWTVSIPKSKLIAGKYIQYKIAVWRKASADGGSQECLATWDDNGVDAVNSILLLAYLKKDNDWVAVCLDHDLYGATAATVKNIYTFSNISQHNGKVYDTVSQTVNLQILGCSIVASRWNLKIDITGSYNEIGGGLAVVFNNVRQNGFFDGGSGSSNDGFGLAGSQFGIIRSDLVVNNLNDINISYLTNHKSTFSAAAGLSFKADVSKILDLNLDPNTSFLTLRLINPCPPTSLFGRRQRFQWDPLDAPLPHLSDGGNNPDDDPYTVNGPTNPAFFDPFGFSAVR